nr:putative integron gene cassette protein [uncultured bacterium]
MFYDIMINGELVATVGPSDLEQLSISVSTSLRESSPFLMANGMSPLAEDGRQTYSTWLERGIQTTDKIQIIPNNEGSPSKPEKVRNFRRGVKATKEDRFCDFCKQSEDVVGKIVQAGDSPFICVPCAELCVEIAKGINDENA